MLKLSEKQKRIIKTCNLYFVFLSLGLCLGIGGPCLIDLQHIVGTDTRHIALIFTARSTGHLAGSIIGGVILDIVKFKQAVMAVSSFFVAVSMLAIPWSRKFEELMGYMTVNGMALGSIENGGTVLCLNLWGKNSAPYFQGLYFMLSLGGVISPLIAAPYLQDFSADIVPDNNDTNFTEYFLNSTPINSNVPSSDVISRIIYPFTMIGGACVINSLTFLVMCIISPTEESHKNSEKDNSKRSFGFMLTVIFFNFFLIFIAVGVQTGYAQMLTTFAVKSKLQLSSTVGSYMTSAFCIAFTLTRVAGMFLAIKLKIVIILLGSAAIASVAAIILLLLMPNEWALWLSSLIFGVGISLVCPSTIGWLNEHIHVTSKIASTFTVSIAIGEIVLPFLIAYFIETIPNVFIYVTASVCVLLFVGIFSLWMFFKKFDNAVTSKEPGIYVIRSSSIDI